MELQEPTLRSAVIGFGWDSSTLFGDLRGHVADVLRDAAAGEDRQSWSFQDGPAGPAAYVWNEERHLHLMADPERLDIIDEGELAPHPVAERVLPDLYELLRLPTIAQVRVSGTWLLAASSLAEASAGIEETFTADDLRSRLQPIGGRPHRADLEFRYGDDEGGWTYLSVEAATTEQLMESHFMRDFDSADLPPAAVVAELQRQRSPGGEAAEALELAERTLESVLRSGEAVLSTMVS